MPSRTNKLRKNPTSEGKRAVFESLKSPENVESILLSDKLNNSQLSFQIKKECKKNDIPIIISGDKEMSKISNTGKHQGIIANLVTEGYLPEITFWNNLLEEKVKLLQDIKFTWDPSQEQWQNYFNEVFSW